jgi:hypothetical protein
MEIAYVQVGGRNILQGDGIAGDVRNHRVGAGGCCAGQDIVVQEQVLIDLDHVARMKINDRVVAEGRLEDKGVVAA